MIEEAWKSAVLALIDPLSQKTLGASDALLDMRLKDGVLRLSLNIDPNTRLAYDGFDEVVKNALDPHLGIEAVEILLTSSREAGEAKPSSKAILSQRAKTDGRPPAPVADKRPDHVKRVIVVASGKGGVGKSTMAFYLALGLKSLGLRVGLLDADIYGPSLPSLTGLKQSPQLNDKKQMIPHEVLGLKVNSIGYLVGADQAMIWRAPMATQALNQLLHQTQWGDFFKPLDVLIVDMPPGTGDIQLTLSQKTLIDGAVIISTPQVLSVADAKRCLSLYEKTNTPILGVVENMAFVKAGEAILTPFGRGGAKAMAEEMQKPFLGEIPLSDEIRLSSEAASTLSKGSESVNLFTQMAKTIKRALKL
jgi:ATP-binding protein involved in chromosome partitioning